MTGIGGDSVGPRVSPVSKRRRLDSALCDQAGVCKETITTDRTLEAHNGLQVSEIIEPPKCSNAGILGLPDSVVEHIFSLLDESETRLRFRHRRFPTRVSSAHSSLNLASSCVRFLHLYRSSYVSELYIDIFCPNLNLDGALCRFSSVRRVTVDCTRRCAHGWDGPSSELEYFAMRLSCPGRSGRCPPVEAFPLVNELVFDCGSEYASYMSLLHTFLEGLVRLFPNLVYLHCSSVPRDHVFWTLSSVWPGHLQSLAVGVCSELWRQLPSMVELRELALVDHARPLGMNATRAMRACSRLERLYVHSLKSRAVFDALPATVSEVYISNRSTKKRDRFTTIFSTRAGFEIPSSCSVVAACDSSEYDRADNKSYTYGRAYTDEILIKRC